MKLCSSVYRRFAHSRRTVQSNCHLNLYWRAQDPSLWKTQQCFYCTCKDDEEEKQRPSLKTFKWLREDVLKREQARMLGADLKLSVREKKANEAIMAAKMCEYNEGLIKPHLFKPSQHFFSVLEQIQDSALYQYICMMPKGGALHTHDTALCSTDFVVEQTYRPNLWVCKGEKCLDFQIFRFSKEVPTTGLPNCEWMLLKDIRKEQGDAVVDEYLRKRFSLFPKEKFEDLNAVWTDFQYLFTLLDGLILYAPVWKDYYYHALEEFYADGVQYLEFRTVLPKLYDMDGTDYKELDTVRIYVETLEKFMRTNPDFIGSRMIYAPMRQADSSGVEKYIRICKHIIRKYPEFVAGFDLVGQEDTRPLKDVAPQLLQLPADIQLFLHAGETNWYGVSVDENLIDAVLLGTKRIGHGFALTKHPLVLEMIKERNIAIEVNPVSNQVLQVVSDLRNHPCAHFFANNYPVVISSDDPSLWKSAPLSHDFYVAFLGIASARADLRMLKKLALNSLNFSSLNKHQKEEALCKWQRKWDDFIENVIYMAQ